MQLRAALIFQKRTFSLYWKRPTLLLLLTLFASSRLFASDAHAEEKLYIGGSGTNLASIRLLAAAFQKRHPEIKIEVPPSLGSTGGIRATSEGALAIGLVSRPLRKSEEGLGLTLVPYAKTAVVMAANPQVPDRGISSADLLAIYQGEKTRWQNGKEIIVLTREPGDSGIDVLRARIPGFSEIYDECVRTKRWTMLFTDQDMNSAVARTPFSLGIGDYGSISSDHLSIKILTLDGVSPATKNVANRKYPLVKVLSLVFMKDRLSPGARAFIEFARSRRGLKILQENGYLPPDR